MDEMAEMLDHYRITKLVAEYCHGCDRLDEVEMANVYADDSWDDHGMTQMDGRGFARSAMARRAKRGDKMSHHLNQTLVRIDGDRAGAETYFIAIVGDLDENGQRVIDQLGGRYVDELVRTDTGAWRITKRLTIRDWSVTVPVVQDRMAARAMLEGQPDQSDPSYAALGKRHSAQPPLQFVPTPNDR
jgi:hypothetical protein